MRKQNADVTLKPPSGLATGNLISADKTISLDATSLSFAGSVMTKFLLWKSGLSLSIDKAVDLGYFYIIIYVA